MAARTSLATLDAATRPGPDRRRRRTCAVDDGAPIDLRVHPTLPSPEPPLVMMPVPAPLLAPPVVRAAPAPMPVPAPGVPEAGPPPPVPALAPPVPEAAPAPAPSPAASAAPAAQTPPPAAPPAAPSWTVDDDDQAAAAAFAEDLRNILDGTHPSVVSAREPVEDGFLEHAAANARTRREDEGEREDDEPEPAPPETPTGALSHDVFDRLTFANRFEAGTMSVDVEKAFDAFDAEHDTALARAPRPARAVVDVPTPAAMDVVEDLALAGQSFDVRYSVQLVPQETGMSCWAAGAAMVVGWRDQVSIAPGEIARAAGYWAQYAAGLEPEDTRLLEDVWDLRTEPGQTYSVDGFRRLLENYGPLWTAGAEPGPHIRVVAGLYGDGTPEGTKVLILDPWSGGWRPSSPATAARATRRPTRTMSASRPSLR